MVVCKCTQEELMLTNFSKESMDELAHLEEKVPSFVYNGETLQIDYKTRQYKVIGKVSNSQS